MEMELCCGAQLVLARRAFVVLHRVRQQRLVCEVGEIWVTLDGQGADYVLASGEGMVIASNARVIVSATRPAVLRMLRSSTAHDGPQPAGSASSRTLLRQLGQHAMHGLG